MLRKERNKEQQHEPSSSIEEDTSQSDIDVEDVGVSSEDDDAFLAKYDDNGNFIG